MKKVITTLVIACISLIGYAQNDVTTNKFQTSRYDIAFGVGSALLGNNGAPWRKGGDYNSIPGFTWNVQALKYGKNNLGYGLVWRGQQFKNDGKCYGDSYDIISSFDDKIQIHFLGAGVSEPILTSNNCGLFIDLFMGYYYYKNKTKEDGLNLTYKGNAFATSASLRLEVTMSKRISLSGELNVLYPFIKKMDVDFNTEGTSYDIPSSRRNMSNTSVSFGIHYTF